MRPASWALPHNPYTHLGEARACEGVFNGAGQREWGEVKRGEDDARSSGLAG